MDEYDDIIELPHWDPRHHKRMSMESRAAQFAPFAALVGHDAAIKESARITEVKIELEDNVLDVLSSRLQYLLDNLDSNHVIEVVYFQKDERKTGGEYISYQGIIKKYDECDAILIFEDGKKIYVGTILSVDGEVLNKIDNQ